MIQDVLSNTLAISLLFSSFAVTPASPATSYSALPQHHYYTVQKNDTLENISEKYYGTPIYWTSIWNKNKFIKHPNNLEEGTNLVMKADNVIIEELNLENKKKIAQYVQSVAYANSPKAKSLSVAKGPTGPLNDAQIAFLGNCESGMTASRNSGNGFYGAFQFMIGTWNSMGTGYERADLAPLDVQIAAVQKLLSRSSIFTQFPGCSRRMQALGLI